MRRGVRVLPIWLLGVVLVVTMGLVYAAEHPVEHPSGPEQGDVTVVTKEELADAIEDYVAKDAALKGGFFLVYDQKAKKPLVLSLLKVHKERLSQVGHQEYFACADFGTPEGKVYDLDIFMKGPNKALLTVTGISIHKEDGKERYTWYSEAGVWKMKPLGVEPKAAEHPAEEHPAEERPAEHPSEHPR
jgi:hypothetical protein